MDISWMDANQMLPRPRHRVSGNAGHRPSVIASPKVSGIVFEMAGVLYDDTVWQRWLLQLLSRIGLHTQYQPFFRLLETEHLPSVYCGHRTLWDALRDYFYSLGLSKGQVVEIEAAAVTRRKQYDREIRPIPGVISTLAQISALGTRMAVITNSSESAAELLEKLSRWGVSERFEVVVSSRELGFAMPAPECYQAVLNRLTLPASEMLFVSADSAHLAGARRVGLATAAVLCTASNPDFSLDRLNGLLAILRPVSMLKASSCAA